MQLKFMLTILLVAAVVGMPSLASAQVLTRSGYTTQLAACCGPPEMSYPAAYNSFPRGLALADLNGDHLLDVTFADQLGQPKSGLNEYVLLNTGIAKFSPVSPLSFPNQKHGTTSPPQTVTLTNEGKTALSITSIKTTSEFGATSTCGKTVAAKASCTISVTFSPKGTGEMSGTVQIHDSASSKPQVISLSGRGY